MTAYDFDFNDVEPSHGGGAGAFPVDDPPEPDDSPVAGPDDPLFGRLDVVALAAHLVGPAVQKAIGKKVDELAAAAVGKALTWEVLDQSRSEAEEAFEAVVRGPKTGQQAPGEEDTPPLYYGQHQRVCA